MQPRRRTFKRRPRDDLARSPRQHVMSQQLSGLGEDEKELGGEGVLRSPFQSTSHSVHQAISQADACAQVDHIT